MMIWIFLGFFLQLSASTTDASFDSSNPVASNHHVEAPDELYKYYSPTDELWDEYQSKLQWFFLLNDHRYEDEELTEKFRVEKQLLIKRILDAQNYFLEFRDKTAAALGSQFSGGTYGYHLRVETSFEITKWFTQFMEENLFPSDWEASYKEYLEKKAVAELPSKKIVPEEKHS